MRSRHAITIGMQQRLAFAMAFISMAFIASIVLLSSVVQAQVTPSPNERDTDQARLAEARLFFQTQVRPILATHCWSCHGPDEQTRQSGLRLDVREGALGKGATGKRAVVTGHPEQSELVSRIESTDPDQQMPPDSTKKPLSVAQKKVLKDWIASGAEYAGHWAFTPPERPRLPPVRRTEWPRNPIDSFVLKKLEQEGLASEAVPAIEAPRSTLLRRVTLDLTGLPPTLEDLMAFEADSSPDAFEKVIDRLLASPRHAERMAMQWLDAARYADTNGYNNDEERTMWPWRDWVIDAFARGMPYDRFLTEQLAGDLIPNAALAQRVATGFNRNHVLTTEGGIIEEEYHVEYVADRVHTTASVFMGLTMQCARCHDHKYDPLTQREYYQFAAFFNNIPDKVVGYSSGKMALPLLKVPSPEQSARLASLDAQEADLKTRSDRHAAAIEPAVSRWEASLTPEQIEKLGPRGLIAHFPLDEANGAEILDRLDSTRKGSIRGTVKRGSGKFGGAVELDGKTFIHAGQIGDFDSEQSVSLAAWFLPTSASPSTILSKMDEANAHRGYDVILEGGKVASHWVHTWPGSAFKIVGKEAVSLNAWHHVVVTYDGTRTAKGVKLYVDGREQPFDVTTNNTIGGTLKTDKPFHIGQRHNSAPFTGSLDDVQVYDRVLSADEVASLTMGQSGAGLKELLAVAPANRTDAQRRELRQFYLERIDPEAQRFRQQLAAIPGQRAKIDKAIPSVMVMDEQAERRPTFVLKRGQYDQRGDRVEAALPGFLSSAEAAPNQTRLDMAQWLTARSHPLTARVAVNRWWEMLFATGLVESSEDFGVQGSLPSHPELLDWLAVELKDGGRDLPESAWDVRRLMRLIVGSAAYCQSSRVSPLLLERDPQNRFLGRGPRSRLSAEGVRDNALAVSGLLCERTGGRSVKPYQPEGLWEDVSVERREKYVPESGEGLYRRSMYTFWKRTSPPPGMSTFDAPDREFCVVRRSRTNTPLQALVLLNDPTYVEAARKLAERTLLEAPADEDARLTRIFLHALTRPPTPSERKVLVTTLQTSRTRFAADRSSASRLLKTGASSTDPSIDPVELASWTTLASLILNLDEAISKP